MREVVVNVRLLQAQADLLDDCSKLSGQSKSELVREAIMVHLLPLHDRLKALAGQREEEDAKAKDAMV